MCTHKSGTCIHDVESKFGTLIYAQLPTDPLSVSTPIDMASISQVFRILSVMVRFMVAG